jgi:LuxR family maltose regulon positive regulatory protein
MLAEPDCPPGPVRAPLLTAKLAVPAAPSGLVERSRLADRLDSGTRVPITMLAAPPGWGKTVLLSSWVRAGRAGCPVAWLSLEPGDEGQRFWAYLRAALDSAGAGYPPAGKLPDDPGGSGFVPLLADALARRPDPVLLVLDDFHQVGDPALLGGLDFLLRHAAGRLRLVLATRAEPVLSLHRWRLGGELFELRTGELAFTPAETGELLDRLGLALPVAQVGEVQAQTEGWPAGVRLAALAIQEHPGREQFPDPARPAGPAQLPGPAVAGDPRIADYLMREVLAGQPTDLRRVLLDTSILPRLCAGLVEALTGRTDGAQVLAELDRTNAFLLPLDAGPDWHRYHRMFGELLRAELHREAPDRIGELHRRAAGWHETQGLPADALRHALAAGDWAHAVRLVTGHWPALLGAGHGEAPAVPVPEPPSDVDPLLAMAYAAERLNRPDPGGAEPWLRIAGRIPPAAGPDRPAMVVAALRLVHAHRTGDGTRVLADAPRLLAEAGPADPPAALALTLLGAAQLANGDLPAAEASLLAGQGRADRAGMSCTRLVAAGTLAFVQATRGRLRAADRTAHDALAQPPCPGQSPGTHRGHAYLALALVAMHRDRLADAETNLRLAEQSGDPAWQPALAASLAIARAELRRERGELTEGYAVLHAGRSALAGPPHPAGLARWFALAEADLHISHGDPASARNLLLPLRSDAPELAVALARAHLHDGDPGAALRTLPARDADCPLWIQLAAGLTEALAARRLGEHRRAARALEQVLGLAEPDGYRRMFTRDPAPVHELLLEHLDSGTAYWPMVSELVAATERPAAVDAPEVPGEPLTERELTILRYLQGILSNVEIAAELSLSINTVKTHVRNIYRKLNANRRRDAVRRARELRLL